LIVFLTYPVFRVIPDFRKLEWLEKVLLTIIASLSVTLLSLVFSGVVLSILRPTSYAILSLGTFGFILFIKDMISVRRLIVVSFVSRIKEMKFIDSLFIITLFFFIVKFTYYLSVMTIMDWDVLSAYLPLARTMYIQDSIPVLTGFDNKSVRGGFFGISVLYAFVYDISGNILAEDFRFLPLLFYLVIISLLYVIARDMHSSNLGKLAVLVYLFLPLTDEVLTSYSYYPDVLFLMLFLGCFWLIRNFNSTKNYLFSIVAGLAAGSALAIKPLGILVIALLAGIVFQFFMRKLISRNGIICEAIRISPLLVGSIVVFIGLSEDFGSDIIYSILLIVLTVWLLHLIDSYVIKTDSHNQKKLIIGFCSAIFFSFPFIIMTLGRNFLLFGSFLFVSWTNKESIQWAVALIESLRTPTEPMNLAIAFGWLAVIFTTPALGTAWFFPKILGLGELLKKKGSLLSIFFSSYFLMWFLFLGPAGEGTTARWLYPLAPFVAFLIAYGLFKSTKSFKKSVIFTYIFFPFSLMQSRMLNQFPTSFYLTITQFIEHATIEHGFSCQEMNSLHASPAPERILGSLYQGFIASSPLIIYYLLRLRRPHLLWKAESRLRSLRNFSSPGKLALIFLTFSLSLLPTIEVTYEYSNGNPFNFGKYSRLSADYDGLYSEILPYIETHSNPNETIIGIDVADTGIQYYLPNIRIVDLANEENLAIFWPLIGKDVKDSFLFLAEHDVNYLLFSKSITGQSLLNNLSKYVPLFQYTSNPSYFKVLKENGSWKLLKPCSLENLTVISHCNSTYGWSVVWGGIESFII